MIGFRGGISRAIGGKLSHLKTYKHGEGKDNNIRKVYIPLR
jgi:hypothetical protein